MSPSVEPPRGGVYARRVGGALSRHFPDVTSSAYCVWQFRGSGSETVGLRKSGAKRRRREVTGCGTEAVVGERVRIAGDRVGP